MKDGGHWTVEISFDEPRTRAYATLVTVRPLLVGEGDVAQALTNPTRPQVGEELAAACALADLAAKLQEHAIHEIGRRPAR